MIISIASGKGGTGKTTIATNLAVSLAYEKEKIQFLDCDVEAPNAHLFLKPEIYETEKIGAPVPEVRLDRCNCCGKCGEMGVRQKGKAGKIKFIRGYLRVGEAMSSPLIREVKKTIKPHHTAIIDAPPGTSCPVVTALKGSDFSILVTEPTPFGLNDLILAVDMVRILGIPFGIVINRSDVGDHRVVEYATQEGIPILLEIPDQHEIAEAYSRGIMMTEVFPAWKKKFGELYQKIKTTLRTP